MSSTALASAASSAPIMALFPGQGSQKVGMGRELAEGSSVAKELFARADEALGFSLSKLCFDGPEDQLTMTANAQPAILTVSIACFALATESSLKDGELIPGRALPIVAAAGHSLGEYSALVAAGVLRFEDAVRVVNLRGKFMQEAVPVGTGKMIAVLGKDVVELDAVAAKVTSGVVSVANINAPGQVVVSGAVAAVDDFVAALGPAKVMPLSVSAPFHCALMKPAADRLAAELDKITFRDARFPIIQNYTATPETSGAKIKANLVAQVCGRVRWVECIERGVSNFSPARFVEFGAGAVLTGMAKRITAAVARVNVDSIGAAAVI
jgi:[acyl-carrier-protein] S-malonyltransferase